MFTVALFTNTIAKIFKQLKYPSIDEDKEDVVYIYVSVCVCVCVCVYVHKSLLLK